jgi:hypothetical protein
MNSLGAAIVTQDAGHLFIDGISDLFGMAMSMFGDYQLIFVVYGDFILPASSAAQKNQRQTPKSAKGHAYLLMLPFILFFFGTIAPMWSRFYHWCDRKGYERKMREEEEYEEKKKCCCSELTGCDTEQNQMHPVMIANRAFIIEGVLFSIFAIITMIVKKDYEAGVALLSTLIGAYALHLKCGYVEMHKRHLLDSDNKEAARSRELEMAGNEQKQGAAGDAQEIVNSPMFEHIAGAHMARDVL